MAYTFFRGDVKLKNRIRELRKKKNLTLVELSDLLFKMFAIKISPDLLSKYERGDRKAKSNTLAGLAYIFGVPTDYLDGSKTIKSIIIDGVLDRLKMERIYFKVSEERGGYPVEKLKNYIGEEMKSDFITFLLSDAYEEKAGTDGESLNVRIIEAIRLISNAVLLRTDTDNFSPSGIFRHLIFDADSIGQEFESDNLDFSTISEEQIKTINELLPIIRKIREQTKTAFEQLAKDKNINPETGFERMIRERKSK
ncbi:XRE family transcriptional regulator [Lactiplantibacillus plantarum]|nr:XRE family transcriptional regulator [Lactiplantibacillus plantarum]